MMLGKITLVFISFLPLVAFAQITFDNGYFIDNDGKKVECLIKNVDWKNNPTRFEYRLLESGDPKTMDISAIKEFGIDNFSRYVRYVVKIDHSSDEYNSLSNERNPVWSEERLLLKELVEGKASLYFYQNGNLARFFFSVNESTVQQLVYKKYLTDNGVVENADFRQQLWAEVRCGLQSQNSIRNISYSSNELVRFFNKYNECNGSSSVSFSPRKGRHLYNLRIKTGIDNPSCTISAPDWTNPFSLTQRDIAFHFDKKTTFRLGLESEFVLPTNRNKWSIIVEPTLQYFDGTTQTGVVKSSISYRSVEIPIGVRHYFFLNERTKMFVNAFLVSDFPFNSVIFADGLKLDVTKNFGFAFGGGLSFGRISAELRYYSARRLLAYQSWTSDYHKLSFILGYRIF